MQYFGLQSVLWFVNCPNHIFTALTVVQYSRCSYRVSLSFLSFVMVPQVFLVSHNSGIFKRLHL